MIVVLLLIWSGMPKRPINMTEASSYVFLMNLGLEIDFGTLRFVLELYLYSDLPAFHF